MLTRVIVLFTCLLITACGSKDIVIVGERAEAIEPENVAIYYDRMPDCEFNVVAHLSFNGGFFSRENLIEGFRHEAAAVGATAVQVTHIQTSIALEYLGSARALRCQPDKG